MLVECEHCGNEVAIDSWAAINRKHHFCSRKCFKTYSRPTERRFWPHVTKTDKCWIWTGALAGRDGRGQVRIDIRDGSGKVIAVQSVYAHRFSWELHKGTIPDGLFVLHKCDVPSCVNPDHLFLGTHAVNMTDRNKKGRQAKGESHPRAKLKESDIHLIRQMRQAGKTHKAIADFFGVCRTTIRVILAGLHWKHVP